MKKGVAMSLSVDITKKYRDFSLNIKFESADGTLGILGASGCGKSLTLKSIAGILTPDRGRIILNGRVLFDSDRRINLPPQKRNVGYLFQNYALFPNMTVEQNIETGVRGNKTGKRSKVSEMVKAFRLEGLEKLYPAQLSGGQQQRVALARIMASNADILLLDEPLSALDYYLKEQLKEQLLEMLHIYRKEAILVTHDRDEAFSLCKNIIIMDKGRLICIGNLKDIFADPKYLSAARLTGCKNISRAEKKSDHELYANDWDVTLCIKGEVPDSLSHVGIRAHYLKAVSEGQRLNNVIEPELVTVMESPFEINLIVQNRNSRSKAENSKIWWKLTKEQWYNDLNGELPAYIALPSEEVLLLTK